MSDQHKKFIDGKQYTIVKATADDQDKILDILKRRAINKELLSMAVLSDGITQYLAVMELWHNATDKELEFIKDKMIYIIENESGEKLNLEDFHCYQSLREKLFMEALQVNFGDFFDFLGLMGIKQREELLAKKQEDL